MKLALPLGLLGLLAILALVLIYILKPKYQDKKVSSTYVWKLSLRYQKRKVPLQWLKSSLLLIIQLLIIVLIALMMSQPQVVLATKTGEKIVILEASASMQTEKDGKSRFDRAKSEISKLAESTTAEEDKFSVILAAEEASFVIRRSDSASYIKQKISEAECTFGESNIPDAMELAEGVLAENPNAEVYLYTDCEYEKTGRVTVVNMSDSEWNAAILNFSAKRVKGSFVFTAEIASYGRASEIAVSLNVDGKAKSARLADCAENGKVSVVWDNLD
ncbi:MAG: VWA domain-containing protein, partial [Clostridia bacterium]|nr:VWA domain-containing protein [Clostridia bacterium]